MIRREACVRAPIGANLAVRDEKGPGRRLEIDRKIGSDAALLELRPEGAAAEVVTDTADDRCVGAGDRRPDRRIDRRAPRR